MRKFARVGRPWRRSASSARTSASASSVPHRVVCLLGLDDGVFPRKAPRDGDDLMLHDPRVGERDPRAEDRQMLLDALLAAGEHLIVTYTGNDERTNAPRPPAVPVGELLDVVDATVRLGSGAAARTRIVVRHPLQPFDPRNFTPGELAGEDPWSFDPVTLEGARALTGRREPLPAFLDGTLPPRDLAVIDSEDLVRFVQHPVRAFLRQRLGISVGDYDDELEDDLSVELDGLGKWGVGQRLIDARLAGVDGRTAILAEIARGTLPPGVLGKPVVDEVFSIAEEIVSEAQALVPEGGSPGSADVSVTLPGGRMLRGTVPGVSGDVLRNVTYSRVAAKHRLAAWVRLLALTAARPERQFAAVTIGRAAGSARVTVAGIPPLASDVALGHLATLVDLWERGMREPLPLYCAASAAYAEAARDGRNAVAAARKAWTSEWNFDKEDKELEHQLVLGGVLDFDELLVLAPRADECGDGWNMSEQTRLGRCARRLWDGLLAVEQVTAR